jgi:hypothetical protein
MYTFGGWFADSDAKSVAQGFIQESTGGNPAVLSQGGDLPVGPVGGGGVLDQAGIRNMRGFDASNPRVCRSPRRRRSESGER